MEAILKEKKKSRKRSLVQVFVKNPDPLLYHGEVLYRNGVSVGNIRSSSYGHYLGGAIGLAMIDASKSNLNAVNKQFLDEGNWELEVGNTRYGCSVSLRPLYDPKGTKIMV